MATGRHHPNKIRKSKYDVAFDILNLSLMALILVAIAYPVYFVLIASVSDPALINAGKLYFVPRGVSLDSYIRVFRDGQVLTGYKNSVIYMVLGTAINLAVMLPTGYALSRRDLAGRRGIMLAMTFTMYFGGGLIPSYLVMKTLGIIDTIWAMVLPGAVSTYNVIIIRTFFETTLPDELLESAKIDGASNTLFFFGVALPLSQAIVAIIALFHAVGHWNAFFNALIYLNSPQRYTLQIFLRNTLIATEQVAAMAEDAETVADKQRVAEMVKYAIIVVASLPVMCVYPFVQKYFVKGVMIGAIKG